MLTESVICDEFEGHESSFLKEKSLILTIVNEVGSDKCDFDRQYPVLAQILLVYQEQSYLLNPCMNDILKPLNCGLEIIVQADSTSLTNSSHLHKICKVIQLLCRVCGYKQIVKHFPHEVNHLEPCLLYLNKQALKDYDTWETRYVLLLWLGMLCTVPFDISSMDSRMTLVTRQGTSVLVKDITEVCKRYLSDPGPTRESAVSCLSLLLTRPDMEAGCLGAYIAWCMETIEVWIGARATSTTAEVDDSFLILGVVYSLAQIFKKGHRSKLITFATPVLTPCLTLCEMSHGALGRKLLSKLVQRIALTFLPPRIAEWRYTRGQRSLHSNLAPAGRTETINGVGDECNDGDSGFDSSVPSELEAIIHRILANLGDKDTVVRWSAAKGVGRITMLLPKAFGNDIVGAVLECFADVDSDNSWHGGCLALAELSRRGLLLPERLAEVVPFVERAILLDVVRGQHSVGAHVRDAACYVCWSFSRAYAPNVMRHYSPKLSAAMLMTALFDREVNCRRAASAAFQENVGRLGDENYPHGIDIITVADYFSVGNRQNAYLVVAPAIASMNSDINRSLISHLCRVKCFHWDAEVRALASKGVGNLAVLDTALASDLLREVLPKCTSAQLNVRHGALITTAELILALSFSNVIFAADLQAEIIGVVGALEKARLYRGRGGELVRQAVCTLVEAIARSDMGGLTAKQQVAFVECLNDHIRQPFKSVQEAARDAMRQVLFAFYSRSAEDPSEKLCKLTVLKYAEGLRSEANVAVTRGYAMLLGVLPARLAVQPEGVLSRIVDCFDAASRTDSRISGEYDAETCSNCIVALSELMVRICDHGLLDSRTLLRTLSILRRGCDDYSVDKRGDVGSWTRLAALNGMERLVYAAQRMERFSGIKVVSCGEVNLGAVIISACGVGVVTRVGGQQPSSPVTSAVSTLMVTYSAGAGHCTVANESRILPSTDVRAKEWKTVNYGRCALERNSVVGSWLTAESTLMVLCAVLKQMAEKMDSMREAAGQLFVRLFNSGLPLNSEISEAISEALNGFVSADGCRGISAINWAQPEHAYSIVTKLMTTRSFLFPVLSGLVLSVGGITASTAATSASCLVRVCSDHHLDASNREWFLLGVMSTMLTLFEQNAHCDRVICPLLKTADVLLRHGALDVAVELEHAVGISGEDSSPLKKPLKPFSSLLLAATWVETKLCTNVNKLYQIVDLLVLIIALDKQDARLVSLQILVKMLGHKYPKIRKYTAEALYVQVLSDRMACGVVYSQKLDHIPSSTFGLCATSLDVQAVLDCLACAPWDSNASVSIAEARARIIELCRLDCALVESVDLALLGEVIVTTTKTTVAVADSAVAANKHVSVDELDSYVALVRDAGY